MSEKKEISKATGVMGIATALSRIAGLVRDMIVAGLFGAGFGTDAFFMAFTIPNLLRRFFAEGSLTAAFVPTFSDVLKRDGEKEAQQVASICWTLLLLVMTAVTVLGIFASPWVVRMIGYGYTAVEGKLALTDFLNRLMFPYIFFVSLLALMTGILNVLGHYFFPSVSTLFLNLSMILCAIFLSDFFDVPVTALAVGVLLGGLLQVLLQVPVLIRKGFRLSLDFHFGHPAVVKVALLMLPGIAGVAIYQINVVVTRLLASFLPEGSVSYLYYGQRLFEFPQGIFIVSLAQAVLPALSRQASLGDMQGLKDSLRYAVSLILIVITPAVIGLVLCSVPVYSLFFMKGAFDLYAVKQTSLALVAFAPGLLFVGVSRVVVSAFYAMHDTRTPVWISFWTFLVNALLGFLLMQYMEHTGLALALTLASLFNAVFLLIALRRKIGSLELYPLILTFFKLMIPSVLMALFVWSILSLGDWSLQGESLEKGGLLFVSVLGGMGIYGVSCFVLKVPEIRDVARLIKKRISRGA